MTDPLPPPLAPRPPGPLADRPPEACWYLPTWGERITLMGWRVIYVLPLALLLLAVAVAPVLVLLWWKLLVVAVALPLSAAVTAARRALQRRTEPFCIHCGYGLTGLPDGQRCPECGVVFSLAEIDDYRRDPHWYIQRQRLKAQAPPPSVAIDAGPNRRPPRRDGT